jgi:hypothetical protein
VGRRNGIRKRQKKKKGRRGRGRGGGRELDRSSEDVAQMNCDHRTKIVNAKGGGGGHSFFFADKDVAVQRHTIIVQAKR